MHRWVNHFRTKILDEIIGDKVIDNKLIIIEQLFDKTEISFLLHIFLRFFSADSFSNIIEYEHNPLRDMYLEHIIISNKFSDNLIDRVIQLDKFLLFIMFGLEYWFRQLGCLFHIFLHVEQQLEQQLRYPQILTDHLLHF